MKMKRYYRKMRKQKRNRLFEHVHKQVNPVVPGPMPERVPVVSEYAMGFRYGKRRSRMRPYVDCEAIL